MSIKFPKEAKRLYTLAGAQGDISAQKNLEALMKKDKNIKGVKKSISGGS